MIRIRCLVVGLTLLLLGIALGALLAGCGAIRRESEYPIHKPYPYTWNQVYVDGMCVPLPNQEWDKYPVNF